MDEIAETVTTQPADLPLELVARELNVTAARLTSWRDQVLLARRRR